MLLHEVLTNTEIEMRYTRSAREQEMDKLARIATENGAFAFSRVWASAAGDLTRQAQRGARAVRSALTRPSKPSEQCC